MDVLTLSLDNCYKIMETSNSCKLDPQTAFEAISNVVSPTIWTLLNGTRKLLANVSCFMGAGTPQDFLTQNILLCMQACSEVCGLHTTRAQGIHFVPSCKGGRPEWTGPPSITHILLVIPSDSPPCLLPIAPPVMYYKQQSFIWCANTATMYDTSLISWLIFIEIRVSLMMHSWSRTHKLMYDEICWLGLFSECMIDACLNEQSQQEILSML